MLNVGDSVELAITDIDRVSGRVIGWSEDRKTVFAEMRLGLALDRIRQLPELPPPSVLRCAFCYKSANEVKKLVASPTAYICDECIEICKEIVAPREAQEDSQCQKS